jgi:AcrR family transcriptional regulator
LEQVDRTQVLEAMAAAMADRGAGAGSVTVADVADHAGITTTAFASLFADREACLLAAFELSVERASAWVLPAFDAEASWLDAVKCALANFLRFVEQEPAMGALLVFYSMGGGPAVQRRRMEVLGMLAVAVDRAVEQMPAASHHRPPPVIAEGVVGAVLAIVQNRLLAEEREPLLPLFGELVSIIVLPYLGPSVARRERVRPAPAARIHRSGDAAGAAWSESPVVRLTYRTARVLRAIGDYPGASNREVAERAGIVDQGQVSKLLSRLESRELIVKIGGSRARGAPNAWQLTEQGELVLSAGSR